MDEHETNCSGTQDTGLRISGQALGRIVEYVHFEHNGTVWEDDDPRLLAEWNRLVTDLDSMGETITVDEINTVIRDIVSHIS